MSENLIKIPPQSGYTSCACRDCMDIAITAAQGGWTLCWECLEAGCTPLPPAAGEWPGRRPEGEYECQREDAYDQECTCDHLRAQYDPTYRQCRFCQSLSA